MNSNRTQNAHDQGISRPRGLARIGAAAGAVALGGAFVLATGSGAFAESPSQCDVTGNGGGLLATCQIAAVDNLAVIDTSLPATGLVALSSPTNVTACLGIVAPLLNGSCPNADPVNPLAVVNGSTVAFTPAARNALRTSGVVGLTPADAALATSTDPTLSGSGVANTALTGAGLFGTGLTGTSLASQSAPASGVLNVGVASSAQDPGTSGTQPSGSSPAAQSIALAFTGAGAATTGILVGGLAMALGVGFMVSRRQLGLSQVVEGSSGLSA